MFTKRKNKKHLALSRKDLLNPECSGIHQYKYIHLTKVEGSMNGVSYIHIDRIQKKN